MPILITPETNIPLPFDLTPEEAEGFRERAKAACASIQALIDAGAKVKVDDESSTQAHTIISSEDFVLQTTPPGTILKLEAMLTEYDHEFLEANRRIANLVTNKLLEEVSSNDPKTKMRALELLGKRKGVNLFSDQVEVTIKQKPLDEIETELTRLLQKYIGEAVPVEAKEVQEKPPEKKPLNLLDIDLDAELGLKGDEDAKRSADSPTE
jgi:hypothetical protein